MSSKTLYEKTCKDCNKIFRTDDAEQRFCPTCLKHKNPHKPRVKVRESSGLTLKQVLRIESIYNRVNGTCLHYGDIVHLIDNTKADRCVCCGDVIPEGRMVCPICESGVKNNAT